MSRKFKHHCRADFAPRHLAQLNLILENTVSEIQGSIFFLKVIHKTAGTKNSKRISESLFTSLRRGVSKIEIKLTIVFGKIEKKAENSLSSLWNSSIGKRKVLQVIILQPRLNKFFFELWHFFGDHRILWLFKILFCFYQGSTMSTRHDSRFAWLSVTTDCQNFGLRVVTGYHWLTEFWSRAVTGYHWLP